MQFTFDVAVLSIFGELDSKYKDRLTYNYHILDKGYNSFPINLPGTLFRKALSVSSHSHSQAHQFLYLHIYNKIWTNL